MRRILTGLALAACVLGAAPAANAAVIFDDLDQTFLDTLGTDTFGAIIDAPGVFSHEFSFTATSTSRASSTITTIRLPSGRRDIDFTSIDVDGVAYTPVFGAPGHEPIEVWSLFDTVLTPGLHVIKVAGITAKTGTGANAASYAGTFNLIPAVEPATWALMIMGFGGAGAMLRRQGAKISA